MMYQAYIRKYYGEAVGQTSDKEAQIIRRTLYR